jgi:hypothetical protein
MGSVVDRVQFVSKPEIGTVVHLGKRLDLRPEPVVERDSG